MASKDTSSGVSWINKKNFLSQSSKKNKNKKCSLNNKPGGSTDKSKQDIKNSQMHVSTDDNKNENKFSQTPSNEVNALNMIEKVVSKLKSQKPEDISIIENTCAILNSENIQTKERKVNLIETMITNSMVASSGEIEEIRNDLNILYNPPKLRKLIVHDNCFQSTFFERLHKTTMLCYVNGLVVMENKNYFEEVLIIFIENSDYKLYEQARILVKLDHPGIPKLLAINRDCTKLAIEKKHDAFFFDSSEIRLDKFTTKQIFNFLIQIAKIVDYLHGQNILLRALKLQHFGYSRTEEKVFLLSLEFAVNANEIIGILPKMEDVYHISPETLLTNKFTTKTDVWAMGYLCLIIFMWNGIVGKPAIMEKFLLFNFLDKRIPCPSNCPPLLYSFIREKLLNINPDERPEFKDIITMLEEFKTKC